MQINNRLLLWSFCPCPVEPVSPMHGGSHRGWVRNRLGNDHEQPARARVMEGLDNGLAGYDLAPGIVQTTLAELTAQSISNSLWGFPAPDRLLVCGGGVHNIFLMRRISAALPDVIVEPTTRHGADPDWVEGLLFAWLARERLNQKTQDTRLITGAKRPVLLGDIFEPPE